MQRVTWWPGDYLRDTGDLSLVEHGAYRVLLDHYYSTDGRLKADEASLFRICRAMTEEEQAAVGKVVKLFFTVDEEFNLHNKKADEIIAENTAYIAAAKEAGKKGSAKRWGNGRPIGNPIANPIGNPMRTPIAASTTTTTNTNTKPLAPSDSANRSAQKVTWTEAGFQIPDPVMAGFKTAYPAASVEAEIAKAHAWALANPKNRKSQWGRFLNGWLQRAQDRARPVKSDEKRFVI